MKTIWCNGCVYLKKYQCHESGTTHSTMALYIVVKSGTHDYLFRPHVYCNGEYYAPKLLKFNLLRDRGAEQCLK